MDSAVRQYLDDLIVAARSVLGENLVGAYAAGSLALDAYQPGRSDIDVALVVEDAVPTARKRALVTALRHENLACPARGLELVVYRSAAVRSGTVEPGFEVELNTGARMEFRETYDPDERPAADGRFWYALDRSILHQSGRALLGPPADEMFADLAPADLRFLLIEALSWWLALPTPDGDAPAPGAEDAVLGACRSLAKHRHGRWLAKTDAGRRIASTGPASTGPASADPASPGRAWPGAASGVIERSIAARAGGTPPSGPEARAFQRWVIDEIRRGHPGSAG
ncbi:nucleotidyltransferase domain-containing protein [Cryptosporangium minutisporangium]|uniref:Nucleotidyltransferase domain-containing protein n=1 Tax=Cryptosporangium minutisporangium TaxID=113569 RepID=A0ABP6T7C2_9ACTN